MTWCHSVQNCVCRKFLGLINFCLFFSNFDMAPMFAFICSWGKNPVGNSIKNILIPFKIKSNTKKYMGSFSRDGVYALVFLYLQGKYWKVLVLGGDPAEKRKQTFFDLQILKRQLVWGNAALPQRNVTNASVPSAVRLLWTSPRDEHSQISGCITNSVSQRDSRFQCARFSSILPRVDSCLFHFLINYRLRNLPFSDSSVF